MVYKLIPIRFKPVLYRPMVNQNDSLTNFCWKYITSKHFISFDDIYNSNSIKNILNNGIIEEKKHGNKSFLLYGPKGCGKTLYVHALANHLGAKIAQIEGIELFKIPFFAREFIKTCFSINKDSCLIIYIRNVDLMSSTINNFNYIYDRVSSTFHLNVFLFASTTIVPNKLDKKISQKFKFFQCIKPVEKNLKGDYIRFIGKKIGIEIKINDQTLNNIAISNLYNYSNEDIFDLIRKAIEIKKSNGPPDDINWVYKEGLYDNDIMRALGSMCGSMNSDVLKAYYL